MDADSSQIQSFDNRVTRLPPGSPWFTQKSLVCSNLMILCCPTLVCACNWTELSLCFVFAVLDTPLWKPSQKNKAASTYKDFWSAPFLNSFQKQWGWENRSPDTTLPMSQGQHDCYLGTRLISVCCSFTPTPPLFLLWLFSHERGGALVCGGSIRLAGRRRYAGIFRGPPEGGRPWSPTTLWIGLQQSSAVAGYWGQRMSAAGACGDATCGQPYGGA